MGWILSPTSPVSGLELGSAQEGVGLEVVYYTWLLTGRTGNGNQDVPEEARKCASLMAKMKATFFTFFSSGHCFFCLFVLAMLYGMWDLSSPTRV